MGVLQFLKNDVDRVFKRYPKDEAVFIIKRDIRAWFWEGVVTEKEMYILLEIVKEKEIQDK